MTDEMEEALKLAREEIADDTTGTHRRMWRGAGRAHQLARALLASQAEVERMTEEIRLIRLQLHAENDEVATLMIDELAHSRGIP